MALDQECLDFRGPIGGHWVHLWLYPGIPFAQVEALEPVAPHLTIGLTIHYEALVKLELIVAHSRQVLPLLVRQD